MKIGSLFSGIGGFELAGEWCGHETIWQSEIDPYCVALLAERFPKAKQLGDITRIDWSTVEQPDIITGGFPCQDISYAGKGAGLAGARSGLWYEYARAIRDVGPKYVIVENVAALFTRGIGDVLGTLADLGYDAEWTMRSAADVGAPHRRHRIWILATRGGADVADAGGISKPEPEHKAAPLTPERNTRMESGECCGGLPFAYASADVADADRFGRVEDSGASQLRPGGVERPPPHPGRADARAWREEPAGGEWWRVDPSDLPDADNAGPQRGIQHGGADPEGRRGPELGGAAQRGPGGAGQRDSERRPAQPHVGRVAHGIPARVDRLRGLGNAIVPACAVPIFQCIAEIERSRA